MKIWHGDGRKTVSLLDALAIHVHKPMSSDKACVISVIGGGGKTSLLYCLAQELCGAGLKVVLTTTTHMTRTELLPCVMTAAEAESFFAEHAASPVMAVREAEDQPGKAGKEAEDQQGKTGKEADGQQRKTGKEADGQQGKTGKEADGQQRKTGKEADGQPGKAGKCRGLDIEDLQKLRQIADVILVEADGSRHLPLKAAASHEPVVPMDSDYVIAVAGLDCIGRPLRSVCHRPELAASALGLELDSLVQDEDVAALLQDETAGGRKWFAAAAVGRTDIFCTDEENIHRTHILPRDEKVASAYRRCVHASSAGLRSEGAALEESRMQSEEHPDISAQFRVLLNKADDEELQNHGFRIASILKGRGIRCAVAALRDRVALIALAAGKGVRFGGDKLNVSIGDDGYPIYRQLLESADKLYDDAGTALVNDRILVTREDQTDIRREAEAHGFRVVLNHAPERGIASSIRLGIEAAIETPQGADAFLFSVCDQPWLTAETLRRLIEAYQYGGGSIAAVRSSGAGTASGNPNIFSVGYTDELLALSGDIGGKKVLNRHLDEVVWVEVPPGELRDVDLPEDLRDAQRKTVPTPPLIN